MDSQVVQPIKCIHCGQQCASLEEHKTTCLRLWIYVSYSAKDAMEAFTEATDFAKIAHDVSQSAIVVNQDCERVLNYFMEVVKKAAQVSEDAFDTSTYSRRIVSLAAKAAKNASTAAERAFETHSEAQNNLPGEGAAEADEAWKAAVKDVSAFGELSKLAITAKTYNDQAGRFSSRAATKADFLSTIVLQTIATASRVTSLAAKASQIAAAAALSAELHFKATRNLLAHDAVEEHDKIDDMIKFVRSCEKEASETRARAEKLRVEAELAIYRASLY